MDVHICSYFFNNIYNASWIALQSTKNLKFIGWSVLNWKDVEKYLKNCQKLYVFLIRVRISQTTISVFVAIYLTRDEEKLRIFKGRIRGIFWTEDDRHRNLNKINKTTEHSINKKNRLQLSLDILDYFPYMDETDKVQLVPSQESMMDVWCASLPPSSIIYWCASTLIHKHTQFFCFRFVRAFLFYYYSLYMMKILMYISLVTVWDYKSVHIDNIPWIRNPNSFLNHCENYWATFQWYSNWDIISWTDLFQSLWTLNTILILSFVTIVRHPPQISLSFRTRTIQKYMHFF